MAPLSLGGSARIVIPVSLICGITGETILGDLALCLNISVKLTTSGISVENNI
jgi:hypothetical protein